MKARKLTRRQFIQLSVLAAGSAALAACGAPATQAPAAEVPPTEAPPAAEPTTAPEPTQAAQEAAPTEAPAEAPAAEMPKYKEAPMLADKVASGALPPVEERLPGNPLVLEPVESIGAYGGSLKNIDTNGMGQTSMYKSVEPLVKWNRNLVGARANVLEAWEWNDAATEVTVHFRKGMKWSDGEPFGVDDYLFWWNDMVIDETVPEVEPAGTRVNGELMKVEKVDDYSLKFSFAAPHPLFLELHSRGFYHSAMFLVPAHYMKKFHPKYNTEVTDANALMDRYGQGNNHFPDMPTHFPWMCVEYVQGEKAVFERNPYYWKVDTEGNQLPYIDKYEVNIIGDDANFSEQVLLRSVAGEINFQVRDIAITDVPLVMEKAETSDYKVILWQRGDYAWPWIMLYYDYVPNKDIEDLMYDAKFRRALSVAIDRNRINEVVALGMAKPRAFALSPESPEFQTPEGKKVYEAWSTTYAQFDPEQAKAWLDEANVKDVNGDGFRELPNGKPLELIVEIPVSDKKSIDSMDLVKEDWEKVGIKTTLSTLPWETIDQHSGAGELMIRAWGSAAAWGLISASPVWAPVEGVTYCGGGQRIGQYYQTGGKQGIPPRPGSMLEKMQKLYSEVISIVDAKARDAKLLEIYQVHIDEGPITLGTVGEHPSPVIVGKNLANVPAFGLVAGWDVSFPGTADPEQFYFKA
jgi:peptide/nickel transport system substrate-binding protein